MYERPSVRTVAKPTLTPKMGGVLQRRCACGGSSGLDGECAACRKQRLQHKSAGQTEPSGVPPIVHEVLRSPGQPLNPATRAFMEPRFGHDFGAVRVHTDVQAAQSARAVNALAYTVGRDVVFGAGQYAPNTHDGKRLMAHELAHTVQQHWGDTPQRLTIAPRSDYSETEAARAAESIAIGHLNQPIDVRSVQLSRAPDDASPAAANGVCGPDITKETAQALDLTRRTFSGWTEDQQDDHCATLTSTLSAGTAWDIDELHNHEWLRRYNPECATGGPNDACFPSVWIQDTCYYPGSVNYVLFGAMCKLCFDHFVAKGGSLSSVDEFTEKSMLTLIQTYKGTNLPFGLRTIAPNFRDSQRWARAGYAGWPTGGATPPGDRSQCAKCSLGYLDGRTPGRLKINNKGNYARIGTGEFAVHWASGRAKTFWSNLWDKSEGWFGGSTWKPNPKDYGF
jgi:hypothetical protein